MIGEMVRQVGDPFPSQWRVVAILQVNSPLVVVAEYQTVASESNWYGTEGYVLLQERGDGLLEDGGTGIYEWEDPNMLRLRKGILEVTRC